MCDGGSCHPRAMAASMNRWAYVSVNSGQLEDASCARAHATPSAVAPTLSVMSQLSSSVLAIVTLGFGELIHFVFVSRSSRTFCSRYASWPTRLATTGAVMTVNNPVRMSMPTSACPLSRIAAPNSTSSRPEHLGLGRRVHTRQRVREADHTDRRGQCERGAAEDEHGGHDVEHVHRCSPRVGLTCRCPAHGTWRR